MIQQTKLDGVRSAIVRLIPSTAIDPRGMTSVENAAVQRHFKAEIGAAGGVVDHFARAVDVALDEVTGEPVADSHGPFEIDGHACLEESEIGDPQRFFQQIEPDPVIGNRRDGEATSVDRDALADGELIRERHIHDQPDPGP